MLPRLCGLMAAILAASGCILADTQAVPKPALPYRILLNRYCVVCHNERAKTAGLMLDKMDLADVPAGAEVWEKVMRKLRSNAMPPQGMPRPDKAAVTDFVSWLETSIDSAAAIHPNPGRTLVHRLNRAEYTNAVRDLLAIDVDGSSLLPPDDSGYGFDNVADVLSVSPMLMERYVSAARKISRLAVGDATIRPATETYAVSKYLRQDDRLGEDFPFGSRGGIAVHYNFPVDGDYFVKIFLLRTYDGKIRGLFEPHELDVLLNGEKIKQFTAGGGAPGAGAGYLTRFESPMDGAEVRFPAKAGPAVVAVTFAKEAFAPEGTPRPDYAVTSYEYAGDVYVQPGVASIEIRGPYDVKGPGNSPSRKRIFVCRPKNNQDDDRCATQILSTLARRAYRRPVTMEDLDPLLAFYRSKRGNFDVGIEMAIRRILVSPDFLFRTEQDPPNLVPGTSYRISDVELASRLSFFLWSSIPDDELLRAAERGELRKPGVLEREVRRMLADERSKALVNNFAGQWLYLRNIRLVSPDPTLFPEFSDNLRQSFAREMDLFLESQFREDHSVTDLLTADYTYLNEDLARHYGIANVYGPHFRRVALTDDARKGFLGKGAILTVTSYANRTSPVLRGKWLLENILGAPPTPPPPNVPALKENVAGGKALSVRERMEEHRANPVCASCHKVMDPLGFALENFDAIGRWRTVSEAGTPVDASGTLVDGTKVDGPSSLREALLAHREDFVTTVTGKLLTYALGRGVEYYDAPAIREIVQQSAATDYRWSSTILGITKSAPFQMRTTPNSSVSVAEDVHQSGK
jgi:hypothetical protein